MARLGAVNIFRGTSRTLRKKVTIVSRGMRARGQFFRGTGVVRGNRGQFRGALSGVRRASGYSRNMRGYTRRDGALKESESG